MKPILFNTDMVRAILDGRKTVARRAIKPQPEMKLAYIMAGHQYGKWSYSPYVLPDYDKHKGSPKYWTPPCHTGDILYVRETWGVWSRTEGLTPTIHYKVDGENLPGVKWRPSIHMPKEAARIFLRVTDVRVERLLDMRLADYLKEGVQLALIEQGDLVIQGVRGRDRFAGVWDSTIKPTDLSLYGWEANPWVWVIEFERIIREEGADV